MSIDAPAPPASSEWGRFGVSDVIELHAGKQSRVFAAQVDGVDVAIKLTDRRLVDRALLDVRMAVVESIAVDLAEVVCPRRLDGELVQRIGGWLMTATPIVTGERLDLSRPETGELMGQTLARLHRSMASLTSRDIPAVAALGTTAADVDRSTWQLLHGDFNDQNLISTPTGLRVLTSMIAGTGRRSSMSPTRSTWCCSMLRSTTCTALRQLPALAPHWLRGGIRQATRQRDHRRADHGSNQRIGEMARRLAEYADRNPNLVTGMAGHVAVFVRSHT